MTPIALIGLAIVFFVMAALLYEFVTWDEEKHRAEDERLRERQQELEGQARLRELRRRNERH